jgi:hypothetical protein
MPSSRIRACICARFSFIIPAVALILAMSNAVTLHAQNTASGTISGQVSDSSGASVPGAIISITDQATKSVRSVVTNDTGRYDIFNLSPGLYDLTFSKPGFSESKLASQEVQVGLVLTLNIALQVGSATSVVEVSASAGAELQTTNATIGSTITGAQLENLPNVGRDANALFLLQPGVGPTGSVAGTVADQNGFQLDGGNNSSDMDGNNANYTLSSGTITGSSGGTPSGVIPTPIETIEEFKVSTAGQTADFNGSGGGQVQMVTKRGTSAYHGSVYEYLLSSYFSANTWKNDHTPSDGGKLLYTPLPKTHQNRYGASIGGPITNKNFLGGKTYFFFNYEARRFPQATTIERTVPTALLKAGVITLSGKSYNINPYPVTVGGVTYQPATCGANAGPCDPRGIGLNPIVSKLWADMPAPNDPQSGDGVNTQGYITSVGIPQTSNNYTGRVDHDFGDKWHLMSSYRYFQFSQNTTNQTDIGGLLGGTFGQAIATAPRVQKPSYWVAGLTTIINATTTNDAHFSFLRNFWQWGTDGAPPQFSGLGGAVEIGGETAGTNALVPYNVNSQSVRQRFWDGHDTQYRDDLSSVKGNHLLQFGGSYQRNYDYHQRDDNGAGIFNNTVYQVGGATGGLNFLSNYIPTGLPSNQSSSWNNYATEVLGIVSQPQTLYTRAGSNLTLQPLGTNLFDQVTIPYYNMYFSDTWRAKKRLTLTYGLGYQIEMPPTEKNGKQVMLVNDSGQQVGAEQYLDAKEAAALQGQTYNPDLGFATIKNVAGHPKYPYNPFYGGVSPRIAVAWTPFGDKTVIRGGYSRIFGRLNGVAQVLNPLLGASIAQPVSCIGASSSGACLGSGGVTEATAFRIGTDGLTAPLPAVSQTLAQPYYPGQLGNAAAGDATVLDKNFKPDQSDVFNFTIQHQINNKISIEAGYIGRIIKNEFQLVNLDAVPTMYTLGGQSFANAFGTLYGEVAGGQSIQVQPFFEAALGGTTSGYCTGYSSCTAAVVAKQKSQITATQVYTLWTNLSNAKGWTLGRTLPDSAPAQTASIYETTSLGHSNYNGTFFSVTMKDWHGITARSNFTWSRSLGDVGLSQSTSSTTVLNPFNIGSSMYGPQPFDIRFVYNLSIVYETKFFKGHPLAHYTLDGWTFAPLFTAQSGAPLEVNIGAGTSDCQSFGESNCSSDSTYENAVTISKYTGGNSLYENVAGNATTKVGTSGNPATGGSGLNIFADPNAIYNEFGRLVLGVDTNSNGAGILRNFPTWNLDMQVSKEFRIPFREGIGVTFNAQFLNMLNHFQAGTPSLNIDSPTTFGVVTSQANTPRQMEFGLRFHF